MDASPPAAPRQWRPSVFWTVMIVAFCTQCVTTISHPLAVNFSIDTGPNAYEVNRLADWYRVFVVVAGAWAIDRWWGAGWTALVGVWLLAGSVLVSLLAVRGWAHISLALVSVADPLILISLPIVLMRVESADARRGLIAFIWLGVASALGDIAASELGSVSTGMSRGAFRPALVMVPALWASWRFRTNPGPAGNAGAAATARDDSRRSITMPVIAATAGVGVLLVLQEGRLSEWTVFLVLTPATALIVTVALLVGSRRAMSSAFVRTWVVLTAATAAFWIARAAALGPLEITAREYGDPWGLVTVLAGLVLVVAIRRASIAGVPAIRGAFTICFLLLASVFILDAVFSSRALLGAVENGLLATGELLLQSIGMMAVALLARPNAAGMLLATLQVSKEIERFVYTIPVTGDAGPAVVTAAAACLFVALLFMPARSNRSDDVAPASAIAKVVARARTPALAVSGALAIGGALWMTIGPAQSADARGMAVAPPTFASAGAALMPNDADLGFALIDRNTVAVGANAPAASRGPDESPAAVVSLVPFAIGKYEVTVAQYRACVTAGDSGCQAADTRALAGPDDLPVRYVSWTEALQYCRWLETQLRRVQPGRITQLLDSGGGVTLPSEAEWEAAASLGTTSSYPWNGPLDPLRANYAESGRLGPVRVGEFSAGASQSGVQDLLGNVAEWTRSEYRAYPYRPDDGRDDATGGNARVIRGGSFYDGPSLVRITSRRAAEPSRGYDFVGFRVAIVQAVRRAGATSGAPPVTK